MLRTFDTHAGHLRPWLRPGMRLLDCGCGTGSITSGLADQVFPGRVTGLDLNPNRVERATRLAEGREQVHLNYQQGDVHQLPFANATFDCVHAHAVLEHLREPTVGVGEMTRVLRQGGLLALAAADWSATRFEQAGSDLHTAIRRYRLVCESSGEDPDAAQRLQALVQKAGCRMLETGVRTETAESPLQVATGWATRLTQAGETTAAASLLRWAVRPGAKLHLAWRICLAIRLLA